MTLRTRLTQARIRVGVAVKALYKAGEEGGEEDYRKRETQLAEAWHRYDGIVLAVEKEKVKLEKENEMTVEGERRRLRRNIVLANNRLNEKYMRSMTDEEYAEREKAVDEAWQEYEAYTARELQTDY